MIGNFLFSHPGGAMSPAKKGKHEKKTAPVCGKDIRVVCGRGGYTGWAACVHAVVHCVTSCTGIFSLNI